MFFSESKVQTCFNFHKLAKEIVHARFLTASQQRARKLDVFLRVNQRNLLSESPYSFNLIPAYFRATPPFHSSIPVTFGHHSMGKNQQDPSVPLDRCRHTSQGYLEFHGSRVTDNRVTLTSHARVSLDHNQLRIPKVILGSCPQNIKVNTFSNRLISSPSSNHHHPWAKSGYGLFL